MELETNEVWNEGEIMSKQICPLVEKNDTLRIAMRCVECNCIVSVVGNKVVNDIICPKCKTKGNWAIGSAKLKDVTIVI